MFKKLKNEAGFSLIEIMISVGLLGMVVLAVSNITSQIGKVERKVNFDTSSAAVFLQIRSAIRNKRGCEKTLVGKTPGEITSVYYGADDTFVVAEKGKSYRGGGGADEKGTGRGGITLIEMRVHGPQASPSDPFPPPPSASENFTSNPVWKGPADTPTWAYITFTYSKTGEKGLTVIEQRTVPLLITTNGGDGAPIKTCYTDLDSYVAAVCSSLNGVIDNSDTSNNDPSNDPIMEPYPCKNIAVEQKKGDDLKSGHHNFSILAKGDIRVGKSLGVGIAGEANPKDPNRPDPGSKTDQITFANNSEIGEVKAAKDVFFDGTAFIKKDMGVGVAHEVQDFGNLKINSALSIGPTAPSTGLRVEDFLGIGVSPSNSHIPGAPTTGQGHVVVKDPANINKSKVIVSDSWDIGAGTNDPDGSKHSLVSKGLIYIETDQTQSNVSSDNYVITKGYFKEQLSTTLRNPFDTLGSNINNALENASDVQVYNIVRSAVCNYELKIDTRVGGTDCTSFQTGIYSLSSTLTGTNRDTTRFSLLKTTSPSSSTKTANVYNCAKSGTCTQVCIGSNCRTTFRNACSAGKFVVAIGRGGSVACEDDAF